MNLTKQQQEAVDSNCPRIVVRAVAGGGKTTTIRKRVERLLITVKPSKIMLLTFTNNMAADLTSSMPDLEWVGTFHSVGLRLLHKYYNNHLKVISAMDNKNIIKEIQKKIIIKIGEKDFNKYLKGYYTTGDTGPRNFKLFMTQYNRYLEAYNLVTFDMIEILWLKMLKDKQITDKIRDNFSHIIVDEFQDTSKIEMDIIEKTNISNVMVVGDAFQNIYQFRGTTIQNILDFGGQVIETSQSFRIPKGQVNFINSIIKKNKIGYDMQMMSRKDGAGATIITTIDDDVAKLLNDLIKKYLMIYKPRDIMILCRTNREVENVKDILIDYPVEAISSQAGWNNPIGGMLFNFISFCLNSNNYHTERLIRGIQLESSSKIDTWVSETKYTDRDLVEIIMESDEFGQRLFEQIVMIASMDCPIEERVEKYYNMIDKDYLFPNWEIRLRAEQSYDICIKHIKDIVRENGQDIGAMIDIILAANTQNMMSSMNTIKIMTVHTSKGLESPVVIVMNIRDGSFPIRKKDTDPEEELRLFYVATTRNKNSLVVIKTGDSSYC